MARHRYKTWLLAIASGAITLVFVDVGLRLVHGLGAEEPLARALWDVPVPPPGAVVTLGGMIRLADDPRIIYELRPGLDVVYQGAPVVTDEHGFRVWPGQPGPTRDSFRILGIGDSVMFGQAIRADETYLFRLWSALSARRPGRRFAVTNTAVPGYNTVMEVETLKEKGLDQKPDLVLIDMLDNDVALPNFIRKPTPRGLFAQEGLWALVRRLVDSSVGAPAVSGLPTRAWDPRGLVPTPPTGTGGALFADRPELAPPEYADFVGLDAVRAALGRLRALSNEQSFDLAAVTMMAHPSPVVTEMRHAVEKVGIPWIDAGAAVARYQKEHHVPDALDSPLRASRLDNHPSGLWHEIAAGEILRQLDELQMLPRAGDPALGEVRAKRRYLGSRRTATDPDSSARPRTTRR